LLTVKGRNEEKVEFSAAHLRKELEAMAAKVSAGNTASPDPLLAGPAPAPLARAESHYRYQIMARTRKMPRLSEVLAKLSQTVALPEGVTLSIDIDPVNLA